MLRLRLVLDDGFERLARLVLPPVEAGVEDAGEDAFGVWPKRQMRSESETHVRRITAANHATIRPVPDTTQ